MTFDYNSLKRAAKDGSRLGNWNGKAVFAASVNDLENKGSGAYYILYDDENKIVSRSVINDEWRSYGEVSESGSVNEYSSPCRYTTAAEAVEAMNPKRKSYYTKSVKKEENSYAPGYDMSERPTGDVKLEIDVEKTLKMAREMTIESLLEGFLSGLCFYVAKG